MAAILAGLGWTGWRLVTDRPLWPFGGEDAALEAEAASQPAASGARPAGQAAAPAVNGETSVRKVFESVMTVWVDSLVSGDFTKFHEILASPWRLQDDPERLKAAYQDLARYKDNLKLFPSRGKLVLLESGPFQEVSVLPGAGPNPIRDTLGPATPWVVRGEWRLNKTTLAFTLTLGLEEGQWKPLNLTLLIFT